MAKKKKGITKKEGLKKIFIYLKPYKKSVITLFLLSVLSAALATLIPYLSGRVIDSISQYDYYIVLFSFPFVGVFFFLTLWFIVGLCSYLVSWRSSLRRDKLASNVSGDYFSEGFRSILELPLSFHQTVKTGKIGDIMSNASKQVEFIVGKIILGFVPHFLGIIFSLVVIFLINSTLSSVISVALLFYIIILFIVSSNVVLLQDSMNQKYGEVYSRAFESIGNILTIKQFTAENYELKKVKYGFLKRAYQAFCNYISSWQKVRFSYNVVIIIIQLFIFTFSIYSIRSGVMTIGELIMFNAYVFILFGPFVSFVENWQRLQSGLKTVEKGNEIIEKVREVYEPKESISVKDLRGEVEFLGVGFTYNKEGKGVLEDINFSIQPGEAVALVGKTGAGKSTLVDLISLYFKPTEGSILIDGIDNIRLDLASLRSKIAIVPQDIVLFNDTIKNNISYGKIVSKRKIIEAAKKAHAHDFVKKLPRGYSQIVGERGTKLSTGEKQKIALARAFLRDPRILILDEPTSSLDVKSEKQLLVALEELMKGRTTFFITHKIRSIKKANKIIFLKDGKIVEMGDHKELIRKKRGYYKRLFEAQKKL